MFHPPFAPYLAPVSDVVGDHVTRVLLFILDASISQLCNHISVSKIDAQKMRSILVVY